MAKSTKSVSHRGRERANVGRRRTQRGGRQTRLALEQLEDRALLTVVFNLHYGAETDVSLSNNGQGLQNPTVNLIFAGNWAPYVANEQSIVNAVQSIVTGPYLTGLAQYSTSGTATMGTSSFNTTQFIPTLVNNYTNNVELQSYVQQSISQFGAPAPPSGDAEHAPIYIVIVNPADWALSTAGTVYGGFNIPGTYNSNPIHLILTSTTADGSNNISIDNLTTIVSHELAERSVNDAQRFYVPSGEATASKGVYTTSSKVQVCDGEMDPTVGPYCYRLGAYLVQAYWSDLDNAAIVPNVNYNSSAADYALYPTWSGSAWARKYDLAITPFGMSVAFRSFQGSNPAELKFNVTFNGQTATFGAATDPLNSVTLQGPTDVKVDDTNRSAPSSLTIGNAFESPFLGGVGGFFPGAYIDISFSQASTAALEVDTSRLNGSTVDIRRTIIDGTVTVNAAEGDTAINVNYVAPHGPLTVNLGGGAQNVNVSSLAEDLSTTLFADVTVNPGTGSSNLNIDDQNATVARHYTVNTGMVSTDIAGAGVIHYGRLSDVKLGTGSHYNTVTVQNTINGLLTEIFANSGDTINVLGTAFASTVNVYGPSVIVNAGSGGHTSNLHGLLYLDSPNAELTVDDSADLSGQNDVVITSTAITGLSDGVIGYKYGDALAMSILGSGGGSTYHVLSVPIYSNSSTTLTCGGTDTVLVGDHGSLRGIGSDLIIHNPGAFTNLTIDGSADRSVFGSYAAIRNSDVSGIAYGDIRFDQTALSALTIYGVNGGDSDYVVYSLPSYFLFTLTTTLNFVAGDKVDFGANYSLQGDWGSGNLICNFSGSGPAAHVVLDGNLDPAGAAYTIGGNNNLTINNATVGLGLTINGFRDQDQVVIDLPGGTVNADLTHTSPGSIVLDGSARLLGTNVAAPLNVTAHARAVVGTIMPTGPITGLLHAFNSVYLVGSMPQDTLHVYDSTNNIAIANDPIQAPYAQFAAAAGDPTTATAGQPFDFTVIAKDNTGATLANYNNQVQWYSYNRATGDYSSSNYEQFTPADQGQHVFHNLVLPVAGTYTLGFDDGWNASSFRLDVVAAGGGHVGGSAGGNSLAADVGASTSAASPAAVASASVASTAPIGDSAANSSVAGDPVVVASDPVAPPSRDVLKQPLPDAGTVSGHSTVDPSPPGDQSSDSIIINLARPTLVAESSLTDGLTAALRNSLSSGEVGNAGVEARDVHPVVKSSAAVSRSNSSSILSLKSVRTAALDEWFEQYGRRAHSHSSHPRAATASDLSDFNFRDEFWAALSSKRLTL